MKRVFGKCVASREGGEVSLIAPDIQAALPGMGGEPGLPENAVERHIQGLRLRPRRGPNHAKGRGGLRSGRSLRSGRDHWEEKLSASPP
jgi:hypothetical protein